MVEQVKQKEETTRLNVFITKKELEWLRQKAASEDSSLSRIVRLALRKYFADGDKND